MTTEPTTYFVSDCGQVIVTTDSKPYAMDFARQRRDAYKPQFQDKVILFEATVVDMDEGRAHSDWPARPGVDVGCDDRQCESCYVQTA